MNRRSWIAFGIGAVLAVIVVLALVQKVRADDLCPTGQKATWNPARNGFNCVPEDDLAVHIQQENATLSGLQQQANEMRQRVENARGEAQKAEAATHDIELLIGAVIFGVLAIIVLLGTVRIANQWERGVILRLGKFNRIGGPGMFLKIPLVEWITERVSLQIEVTDIKAEKALTKDTVPVDVQTVLFWRVIDPVKAVIEVFDYEESIQKAAQVSLREAIGAHTFVELLSDREKIDRLIMEAVARKATAWGVEVQAIEIKDVTIPADLEAAMSREAQAERERHARIILGDSEIQIAEKFVAASKVYGDDSTALQLRAMNIIYETTKERGSTILLPTGMLDALSSAFKKGK